MDVINNNSVESFRLNEKTRRNYNSCLSRIKSFFIKNNLTSYDQNTNKFKLPMVQEDIKQFLDYLAQPRLDGTVLAYSTVNSYINSIKFAHTEEKKDTSFETKQYLSQFYTGYKNIVAQKKNDGIMKNFEGKVPISYLLFTQLAAYSLKSTQNCFFVHCYLIYCWNMFARYLN